MTKLQYLAHSDQYKSIADVVGFASDEQGTYITLNETIFYPQGGGQPYDVGIVDDDRPIYAVRKIEGQIRHYTGSDASALVGKKVSLQIDKERRIKNSRLHTAGHLLSHVVETLYSQYKAVKGHHYADGAYVEFVTTEIGQAIDLHQITKALQEYVAADLVVTVDNTQSVRLVQIGDFPAYGCGGTHVQSLACLTGLVATKQKVKGTTLRITYTIE